MGMKKRSVEPDSPQSRSGSAPVTFRSPSPSTAMTPFSSSVQLAPRAETQPSVARISWEKARFLITLLPPARAAQRMSLWA